MLTDLFLLGVGLVLGIMNAVAGGGGLIGFPALIAAGLSALSANATGFVVMLPGQLASAFGYRKFLRSVPKSYTLLIVPLMAGAAIGSFILRNTSNEHFGNLVPWLILAAVGLFAFQPFLQEYIQRHMRRRIRPTRPILAMALALFPLAIYGGYFGPGFGFILLAFLSFANLPHIHQMNGMKNIAAVSMALASIVVLSNGSFIYWHAGLVMGAGSIIGGYGGARLVQKVPSHFSRIIVIFVGVLAAAYLALRNY